MALYTNSGLGTLHQPPNKVTFENKARVKGYFYSRKKNYTLRNNFNPTIAPNVSNNIGLFTKPLFGNKLKQVGNYDGELAIKSKLLTSQGFRSKFKYRHWQKYVVNVSVSKMAEKRMIQLIGRMKTIVNMKLNIHTFRDTSRSGKDQTLNQLINQSVELRAELESMIEKQNLLTSAREGRDNDLDQLIFAQEFDQVDVEIDQLQNMLQENEAKIEQLKKEKPILKIYKSKKAILLKPLLYLKNLKKLMIQSDDEFFHKDDIKNLIRMKNLRSIMFIPFASIDTNGYQSEIYREMFAQTHIKGISIGSRMNQSQASKLLPEPTKQLKFRGNSTLETFSISAPSKRFPSIMGLVEPYLEKTTSLKKLYFSELVGRSYNNIQLKKHVEQLKELTKQFQNLEQLSINISIHDEENYSDFSEALAKISEMTRLNKLSIDIDCFEQEQLFLEILEQVNKISSLKQFSLRFKDASSFLYGNIEGCIDKLIPFKKLDKFYLQIQSGLSGSDYDLLVKEFGCSMITEQFNLNSWSNQSFTFAANEQPLIKEHKISSLLEELIDLSTMSEIYSRLMLYYPENLLQKYENKERIQLKFDPTNYASFKLFPIIFKTLKNVKEFILHCENRQTLKSDLAFHIGNFQNLGLDECFHELNENQAICFDAMQPFASGLALANLMKAKNVQKLTIQTQSEYFHQTQQIYNKILASSNLKHLRIKVIGTQQLIRGSIPKYIFSLNKLESLEIETAYPLAQIAKGNLKNQDMKLDNLKRFKLTAGSYNFPGSLDNEMEFILMLSNLPKIEILDIEMGSVSNEAIPRIEDDKKKIECIVNSPKLLRLGYKVQNRVESLKGTIAQSLANKAHDLAGKDIQHGQINPVGGTATSLTTKPGMFREPPIPAQPLGKTGGNMLAKPDHVQQFQPPQGSGGFFGAQNQGSNNMFKKSGNNSQGGSNTQQNQPPQKSIGGLFSGSSNNKNSKK